jgi:hypothetical protein
MIEFSLVLALASRCLVLIYKIAFVILVLIVIQLKLKLKLFTTCAGKLARLLSLGPLYFAIQDLLAS